jgi:predicted dienelactone hydrolase
VRPLEVTLLISNLVCVAAPLSGFRGSPSAWRLLSLLPCLAAVLHLFLEGYRWQMLPGYLGVVVSFFVLWGWPRTNLRVVWGAAGLILAGGCFFAAGLAYPVFTFPAPTGPYAVGTTTRYLIDSNREETHAGASTAKRELMIQIWYPAVVTSREKLAPYVMPNMPGRRNAQLALVKTRSLLDAPVSKEGGPFPIVLFSPAIGGSRYQNTFQLEELASHGFVVVGIDHPYSSNNVVFPDGRRIRIAVEYLDVSSLKNLQESTRRLELDLAVRVGDASFVADTLTQWNRDDPGGQFNGRLNTQGFGVIGHSYGGAVAADLCRGEARFVAGMNLDGWMFGGSEELGVQRPFFFVLDDEPAPTLAELNSPDPAQRTLYLRVKEGFDAVDHSLRVHGGYFLAIKGTAHFTYTDYAIYSKLRRFGDAGTADPNFVYQVLNRYTVAFFKKYLYGSSQALLDLSAPAQPGVTFQAFGGPSMILSKIGSSR